MAPGITRRLFREMVREEFRLHADLFGGRRFVGFPAVVLGFVLGATLLLDVVAVAGGTVVAGGFALTFVFGLHTGTVGFIGRDAARNVLGDVTFLVFSARTLPLSPRRLLAVFVVKDLVYYGFLVVLPVAVGLAPAVGALDRPVAAAIAVAGLWIALLGTFMLGMATTLVALGLLGRGLPRLVAVLGVAAGVGLGWWAGLDLLGYTPHGAFVDPSPGRVVGAAGLVAAMVVLAVASFDLSRPPRTRHRSARFERWNWAIGDPVATKSILDVHRSDGGFLKVFLSGAILFAVTAVLVEFAGVVTGTEPSVGVSFGAILGLAAFTTYNWLTQNDDIDTYGFLPLDVRGVLAGKGRAFLLLGPAVSLAFYVVALAWLSTPLLDGIVGAVLVVSVAWYILGVTVALTGLSPNEFLFDTALFAVFGVAMVVGLVPILVAGFVLAPLSPAVALAILVLAVVLAGVGAWLFGRAPRRWDRRLRR